MSSLNVPLNEKSESEDSFLKHALEQIFEKYGIQDITQLTMMPDTGLAHIHVWLTRESTDDWVARIPKQSQMNLLAQDNLAYQTACFERAGSSGNTPLLHQVIPPQSTNNAVALSKGCLLVSAITGRAPKLPAELPAIAHTLASIHSLPVPEKIERAPLFSPDDPWHAMLEEIEQQASYLDQASLSNDALITDLVRDKIRHELAELIEWRAVNKVKGDAISSAMANKKDLLQDNLPTECRLISFDAHPGNFLMQENGKAILVDLEKCRYSLPGFDLAHASLYTSTTWDPATHAELTLDEVRLFYQAWASTMTRQGCYYDEVTLLQCRRAMWLWSITWCAKWSVENQLHSKALDGQNWSNELSDANLVSHVANRVAHYLSEPIVLQVCDEWDTLWREGLLNDNV